MLNRACEFVVYSSTGLCMDVYMHACRVITDIDIL